MTQVRVAESTVEARQVHSFTQDRPSHPTQQETCPGTSLHVLRHVMRAHKFPYRCFCPLQSLSTWKNNALPNYESEASRSCSSWVLTVVRAQRLRPSANIYRLGKETNTDRKHLHGNEDNQSSD